MREKLAQRDGMRGVWRAAVKDTNVQHTRGGYPVRRILLVDVTDLAGNEVTDHVHFTFGKWCERVKPGDKIQFCARVRSYRKGYHDRRTMDYRLDRPTDIRVLCDATVSAEPDPSQPELF